MIDVIINFLQNYIARFGHGSAKLARQAQSKEKVLSKMVANGLTERVVSDKVRPHLPSASNPLGIHECRGFACLFLDISSQCWTRT